MWKQAVIVSTTAVALATGSGMVMFWHGSRNRKPSAWDQIPMAPVHIDHTHLISGPLRDGPTVTRTCLSCHPNSAQEVMETSHWTWTEVPAVVSGGPSKGRGGKRSLINNFCMHAEASIKYCSSCHVGYGWKNDAFDFSAPQNVDCLVCHEQTGSYVKSAAGMPKTGVDLLRVAQSVGRPTRRNCGRCHFYGCGVHALKRGDLAASLNYPSERIDVHMGKYDMQCVDCHHTKTHKIPGHGVPTSASQTDGVTCHSCHGISPHGDQRLDDHVGTVACQTCHIPYMAIDYPTSVSWDWSVLEMELPFERRDRVGQREGVAYIQNERPHYLWYNGEEWRYSMGHEIEPSDVVLINRPSGDIHDPQARIFPFKIHRGKQVYDKTNRYLLAPKLTPPGDSSAARDWDEACRVGATEVGLDYSGHYAFVETKMHLPISHMVQTKENALQCFDCHGEQGIMDWETLGYDGDPAFQDQLIQQH